MSTTFVTVTPDRCLGRKAIVIDSRTVKLATYLSSALPPPPPCVEWSKGITNWGMMLNDKLGDCTIAGCGHAIQTWSINLGKEITLSNSDILRAYEEWDGYKPSDPSTDQGGIELNVLKDWKNTSFKGHHLLAFASVNFKNITEVKQAINLFGGVYIGVALPVSAQKQTTWDVVPDDGQGDSEPGSWGGHCVFVNGYNESGFTCITWGELMNMTKAFWLKYVDESYCLLGADWFAHGVAPNGFALQQLQADVSQIQ